MGGVLGVWGDWAWEVECWKKGSPGGPWCGAGPLCTLPWGPPVERITIDQSDTSDHQTNLFPVVELLADLRRENGDDPASDPLVWEGRVPFDLMRVVMADWIWNQTDALPSDSSFPFHDDPHGDREGVES